jgi:hypothetical protein
LASRKRWEGLICFSIIGGIILGILIDINKRQNVLIYEAKAQEVSVVEEKEVKILIEVTCDDACKIRKVREIFPETPNTAVAVMMSEGGLDAKAYNPEAHGNVCYGSYGVFQISCEHHLKDPKALFDFDFNLKKAREVYDKSGKSWHQWGGYTSGSYKKFL